VGALHYVKNKMTLSEQATEFRKIFGQEVLPSISRYGFIKKALWDMQVGLINEESCEFLEAAEELFADPENNTTRENLVKELSDLVFVCYQFAATYGIDLDKAMDLVYQSNLSKLDELGNPIYRSDGKVLKGPNYEPPDLKSCLPPKPPYYYDTNGK
jgi:NTP pyrophosphatase (non-canonical NTP hydrolase)